MFYNHGNRIFDQSWLIFGIWMNLKDAYSIMMMSRPLVSMPWWFAFLSFSLQIVLFSVILTGMLGQMMISSLFWRPGNKNMTILLFWTLILSFTIRVHQIKFAPLKIHPTLMFLWQSQVSFWLGSSLPSLYYSQSRTTLLTL